MNKTEKKLLTNNGFKSKEKKWNNDVKLTNWLENETSAKMIDIYERNINEFNVGV